MVLLIKIQGMVATSGEARDEKKVSLVVMV
jgi:hypothetical protein